MFFGLLTCCNVLPDRGDRILFAIDKNCDGVHEKRINCKKLKKSVFDVVLGVN